ncbi:MAG TPA: PP2C family protein-serine/threonine phosphatase [Spirochaetota bacterium]|nr:PP2C family protein-serine/threonine phosphatase [Spirochaetota bacterium]HPP04700.1 PP2C family protein-serine/threonine phosphatase [Spirochaetota bacterium]
MKKIIILNEENIKLEEFINILKNKCEVIIKNNIDNINIDDYIIISITSNYNNIRTKARVIDIFLYFYNNNLIEKIITNNFIEKKFDEEILKDIDYFINAHCEKLKKEFETQIKNLKEENERIEIENKNFHRELNFASELQKNLLPKEFPFLDRINFVSKYLPSTYIGGDFFDIVKLDDNRFAILIIDVSGHGVKSAIIASMIKAIFQKEIRNYEKIKDFFYKTNIEFQNIIQTDDYLTACLIVVDLEKYTLTYSNAAHPNPILLRDNEIIEFNTNGFVIGILSKNFYDEDKIKIQKGDKIFLYTDGIIETIGENNQPFGKERLINIIKQNSFKPIEDIADTIMTELIFFSQNPMFEDDITLFAFEIL